MEGSRREKDGRALNWILGWIVLFGQAVLGMIPGDDIRFKHLANADGLSQGAVNCMLQDRKGFMWFGTQDGLNRYDGYTFKIYIRDIDNKNTISDNYVWCIYEDKKGFLWIGTKSGGLNCFDPKTEKFTSYKHDQNNLNSISNNEVKTIFVDSSGLFWIGTRSDIIDRFNPEDQTFKPYPVPYIPGNKKNVNFVNVIYELKDGVLLIGSDSGLYYYDCKSDSIKPEPAGIFNGKRINAILEDDYKKIWIGTNDEGLFKWNRKATTVERYRTDSQKTFQIKNNTIKSLFQDRDGSVWIGTQVGLHRLDTKTNEIVLYLNNPDYSYSLGNNDVLSIFQEKPGGMMWFGTYGGGVSVYDPDFQRFKLYNTRSHFPGLSTSVVFSIYENREGILWIGTYMGGLNRLDRKTGKYTYYLEGKDIRCFFEDEKGMLWLGTFGEGVIVFNPGTESQERQYTVKDGLSHNRVVKIIKSEKRPGELWIATYGGGLNRFNSNSFKPIAIYRNDPDNANSLSHDNIREVIEDKDGNIWIGTDGGGLNRFNPNTGKWSRFQHDENIKDSLTSNRMMAMHIDRKRNFWIGTDSGGLNRLIDQKKGRFESFGIKDGLPNEAIYGILEDNEGNIWLSTDKGISRFNPDTKKFKNFDVGDGLQANEFNIGAYLKNKKGEFFWGGLNGFNSFFPEEIKNDTFEPEVVITDFLILNKPVQIAQDWEDITPLKKSILETRKITLNYNQNMFSFEFAALAYSNPLKNKYRYKLTGYNEQLFETDAMNRRATYTNLPAGKYYFVVTGSNKDGLWKKQPTFIEIIVFPPPWKTWWAYTLYGIVIVSIVILLIWFQHRKVKVERKLSRELEQNVKDRTAELNSKNEALKKINRIVGSINTETGFVNLLKVILKESHIIKGMAKAAILVWDDEKKLFCFETAEGWDFEILKNISMSKEEAEERYIKNSKEIHDDIFIAKKIPERPLSDQIEDRLNALPKSMLITRICTGNCPQAYFIFSNMQDENAFDDQDILILKNLKEHIVAAFQKTRLIQILGRRNKELKELSKHLLESEKLRTMGTLLAGVAHELNNPAASIMLNAEFFSKAWKDIASIFDKIDQDQKMVIANLSYNESRGEIEKLIEGLIDSSRRIKFLLEELKSFSRKDIPFETIYIDEVINSAINLTQNQIKKSTQRFFFQPGENIPEFKGNSQRLIQVFINLIQNACEALADNTHSIIITTGYDKQSNEIIARIKDEGVGIEAYNLSQITDAFFTTKREIGGIGLGLSISQKIIHDEHQGRMVFESEPGQGTTVSIYLPIQPLYENAKH